MASTQDPRQADRETAPSLQPLGPRTEAIRAPLATILGHTQYLRRHFLGGRPVSGDSYLSALSSIERAVWALEGHLRVLENERRRDQGDG